MIVSVTVPSDVRITETVPSRRSGTYALVPSGENTACRGPVPTVIVFTTVSVVVSITETVPL